MDPEMTVFDTGACVARVSLAVRGKKPANGGDEMSAEAAVNDVYDDGWIQQASISHVYALGVGVVGGKPRCTCFADPEQTGSVATAR